MKCRHCGSKLELQLVDLGSAPPSNAYLTEETLHSPEVWIPLRVLVCEQCWLVQTEDYIRPDDLFLGDYAYFSSTSKDWLMHAACYAGEMISRLDLNSESLVIEIASNDGYLLRNFVAADIPCLGIEPTAGTADAAERLGVPVLHEFFSETVGKRLKAAGKQADLVIGNNVYAHVPDINDFTRGLKAVLKPGGTLTLEFPHLLQLVKNCQFDTIYHEHFSYLSLYTVQRIFIEAGLRIFDVQVLETHGGSLRIFGCHANGLRPESQVVGQLLQQEIAHRLQEKETYQSFQKRVNRIKDDLLLFLLEKKRSGKVVGAYGAAAKGNTLLNYAGVRPDLLPFVCDAAPSKQGKYLPGSRIPIFSPSVLRKQRPDYLLILPWNIAEEVIQQNKDLTTDGTEFVVGVPQLRLI
jgi:SAM-dependent methyltransferase